MNARDRLEKLLNMADFIHGEINALIPGAVTEHTRERYPAVRRLVLSCDGPNELHPIGALNQYGAHLPVGVSLDETLADLVSNLRVCAGQASYNDELGWYFDIPAVCAKCGRTAEEDDSCADDTYGRHTFPA